MNSGGRIPPALQSKVEDYWSNYQEAHKGIDIKPFEHQMGLFLKGLKQAPDGRYIAHVDTHINLHSAELQADPRIKWVNDKGEEVKLPGVDVEEPSSFAAAEPPPPPAPGAEAMQAGAKRFAEPKPSAELEAEIFGPPKHADLGMSDDMYGEVFSRLQDEQDAHNPGLRNLGGPEMVFKVVDVPYEPLAKMGDVASGKALAEKLTKEFEGKLEGEFGVVRKGKEIYLMSPANMKELKALPDGKREGWKIE